MNINGYPIIYKPENKHANKDGYMYEHIYIAEQILGRELTSLEVVHHKDFNRSNNSPSNLIVLLQNQTTPLFINIIVMKNYYS